MSVDDECSVVDYRKNINGVVTVTLEYEENGENQKVQYNLLRPTLTTFTEFKYGLVVYTTELSGENVTSNQWPRNVVFPRTK